MTAQAALAIESLVFSSWDDLARYCLKQTAGIKDHWEQAAKLMRKMLMEDPQLYEQLVDMAVSREIESAIARQAALQRRSYDARLEYAERNPAAPILVTKKTAKENSAHDAGMIGGGTLASVAMNMYDFPLPGMGGLKVGNANKQQILAGAAVYTKRAKTMTYREKWLLAIAERMPDDNRVRVKTILSNNDLNLLYQEARAEGL